MKNSPLKKEVQQFEVKFSLQGLDVKELIFLLAEYGYYITMDQWRDQYKHWRVGLDWDPGDDRGGRHIYVCELPTLRLGLMACLKFHYETKPEEREKGAW